MSNNNLSNADQAIHILTSLRDITSNQHLAYWVAPNTILTLAGLRGYCDGVFYNDDNTVLKRWQEEIKEGVEALASLAHVYAHEINIQMTTLNESYVSYNLLLRAGLEQSITSSRLINPDVLEKLVEGLTGEEVMNEMRSSVATIAGLEDSEFISHCAFGILLGYPDVAIRDYLHEELGRDEFSTPLIDADIRGATYYICPQPVYSYHRDIMADPQIINHEQLWSRVLKDYYTSDFHRQLEADASFKNKLIEIGLAK